MAVVGRHAPRAATARALSAARAAAALPYALLRTRQQAAQAGGDDRLLHQQRGGQYEIPQRKRLHPAPARGHGRAGAAGGGSCEARRRRRKEGGQAAGQRHWCHGGRHGQHAQPARLTGRSSGSRGCSFGTARRRKSTHPPTTAGRQAGWWAGRAAAGREAGSARAAAEGELRWPQPRRSPRERPRYGRLAAPSAPSAARRTLNSAGSRWVSHSMAEAVPYQ